VDSVAIMETKMRVVSYISGISYSVASPMTGFRHTHTCCLSKPRSCLEAGKKQLRVWLQYVYCLIEVLLYSSFTVSFVALWYSFSVTEILRISGRDVHFWQLMFMCQRSSFRGLTNLCSFSNMPIVLRCILMLP